MLPPLDTRHKDDHRCLQTAGTPLTTPMPFALSFRSAIIYVRFALNDDERKRFERIPLDGEILTRPRISNIVREPQRFHVALSQFVRFLCLSFWYPAAVINCRPRERRVPCHDPRRRSIWIWRHAAGRSRGFTVSRWIFSPTSSRQKERGDEIATRSNSALSAITFRSNDSFLRSPTEL